MGVLYRIFVLIQIFFGVSSARAQDRLKLWYDKPAGEWVEALPVGNGRIGAMVFGGVSSELIRLNESSLWSGCPVQDSLNIDSPRYLPMIRKALFEGDFSTAAQGCRHTGMRFRTCLKVVAKDGGVSSDTCGVRVERASEVVLLLSAATSFNGFDKYPDTEGVDEKSLAGNMLHKASAYTYKNLKKRHVADFRKYFDRFTVSLGQTADSLKKIPTDRRLIAYARGLSDPELEALYFQYGRYLLISSSRVSGRPANLQGIWNPYMQAPWSSNYTINVNTEMNYWPAEVTSLSEMHEPLLDWISGLSHTGMVTARQFYGCRGWVAHQNSDIWCMSNPVGDGVGDPTWANWYMGGNWLCRHLYEHYAYTRDKRFLQKAYPIMKNGRHF